MKNAGYRVKSEDAVPLGQVLPTTHITQVPPTEIIGLLGILWDYRAAAEQHAKGGLR